MWGLTLDEARDAIFANMTRLYETATRVAEDASAAAGSAQSRAPAGGEAEGGRAL